jgi:predicted LPLAT superfamily acyltransferase
MTPDVVIAIPVYNNPTTIADVVRDCLEQSKLPVLVIDDGSDLPVAEVLKNAGIADPRVHQMRLSPNQGKGAALKSAFAWAIRQGYTHCLTLDGDGQHLASEIIRLEKAAWQNPWHLIIGNRTMTGEHVPVISHFGRKFSNFWVRYETGVDVRDSQSGMRVYPLFYLQNCDFLTTRYDFEIESLTRAVWNGAGVTEVPVAVHYPAGSARISHFRKFRDNVRISLLNTLLVTQSLFRRHLSPRKSAAALLAGAVAGFATGQVPTGFFLLVPVAVVLQLNGWLLLAAMTVMAAARSFAWFAGPAAALSTVTWSCPEWLIAAGVVLPVAAMTWHALTLLDRKARAPWTAKMRGGRFGNFFMQQVSRRLGLAATYVCLFFIAPYFYLFAPKGKRASLEYLKQAFPGDHAVKRHLKVVSHFYSFGQILLDRLFQSQSRDSAFKLEIIGRAHVAEAFDSGKGAILLSAHVGGWDISTRAMLLEYMKEKLAVAEHPVEGNNSADNTIRKGDELMRNKVQVNDGQVPILQYRNMLDAGQIVAIMGDRPLTDKVALVRFFGKLAPFDLTPFRIAASCNAPVIFCFAFKTGFKSYEFVLDAPRRYEFPRGCDRDALTKAWVQEFADRLESELRRHPYQWLNFFPFFSTAPRRIGAPA